MRIQFALLGAVLCLNGCCSLPRIHVLSDPLTPTEHLTLGVSYERQGEYDPALRQYEQAAKGPLKSKALTYQGNVYLAQTNSPAAEKSYRAAIRADENNVEALNNLAWHLAQQNRSLDEAEELIRRALAKNPEPRQEYEKTLKFVQDRKTQTTEQ